MAAGLNPMDLRRGTQLAVDHVVSVLNKISKAVTSKAEVSQVRLVMPPDKPEERRHETEIRPAGN